MRNAAIKQCTNCILLVKLGDGINRIGNFVGSRKFKSITGHEGDLWVVVQKMHTSSKRVIEFKWIGVVKMICNEVP